MELLTLEAKKVKTQFGIKTELYKNGKLYAVFPEYMKQPHGNCKKIMLNCYWGKLKWIKNV